MNRQKGQSIVEFALIIPLVLLVIMGMIYGAFAYADYLQCTTSVREAARNIAMQTTKEKRSQKAASLTNNSYQPALYKAKLYTEEYAVTVTEPTDANPGTVEVSATLQRKDNIRIIVLPERLGPVKCTMPIEPDLTSESSSGNT